MKRHLPLFAAALALLIPALLPAAANVVRPAPDFVLATGKPVRSLRGQPVVLLVAPSPRSRAFRKQVRRLEADYQRYAARSTVFVAAFTQSAEGLESNIPFVIARDGASVAAQYGVNTPFGLAVIGRDGNLDLITSEVSGGYRVRDAILNNYELQTQERRPPAQR